MSKRQYEYSRRDEPYSKVPRRDFKRESFGNKSQSRYSDEAVLELLQRYGAVRGRDGSDVIYSLFRSQTHRSKDMFRAAFTTKQMDPMNNMEMFELVGDSVLNCLVVAEVMRRDPSIEDVSAGIIYRIMNEITSTAPLARVAKASGIAALVRGETSDKVLEDTVEAVIGALVLHVHLTTSLDRKLAVYDATERFVLNLVADAVNQVMERAVEANRCGRLVAAFTKESERANHVLSCNPRRKFRIVDERDGRTSSVRELDEDGKPFGRDILTARGRDKKDAHDRLNSMIVDRPELFGASRADADLMGNADPKAYTDYPVVELDRKRVAHVQPLFDEFSSLLDDDRGAKLLRAAFTDPRIDPTVRGHGLLNMLGDRLIKMFCLVHYIPQKFPATLNSGAVSDVSSALAHLSQCRPTIARKLGFVRFTRVASRAFHITSTSNSNATNKNYADVIGAAFSSTVSVGPYLATNGFRSDAAVLGTSMRFMNTFLEPILDSVSFDNLNKSFSVGGKAMLFSMVRDTASINRADARPSRGTDTHRECTEINTVFGGVSLQGLGINKSDAQDDLADEALAAVLGHPYRTSLDPGTNLSFLGETFQLFG